MWKNDAESDTVLIRSYEDVTDVLSSSLWRMKHQNLAIPSLINFTIALWLAEFPREVVFATQDACFLRDRRGRDIQSCTHSCPRLPFNSP